MGCFMVEVIAVNDSLEFVKINKKNKSLNFWIEFRLFPRPGMTRFMVGND